MLYWPTDIGLPPEKCGLDDSGLSPDPDITSHSNDCEDKQSSLDPGGGSSDGGGPQSKLTYPLTANAPVHIAILYGVQVRRVLGTATDSTQDPCDTVHSCEKIRWNHFFRFSSFFIPLNQIYWTWSAQIIFTWEIMRYGPLLFDLLQWNGRNSNFWWNSQQGPLWEKLNTIATIRIEFKRI